MIPMVERLMAAGTITLFAGELGDRVARLVSTEGDWVALAAIVASESTSDGHACIDLAVAHQRIAHDWRVELPALDRWRAALLGSGIVAPEGGYAPLVLDDADRLYLLRYWRYEQTLAREWSARAAEECAPTASADHVRAALDRWFPLNGTQALDNEQRRAAAIALYKPVCVIAGGPGTGKTTTAARILAILAELATTPLRIAMVAPTGKAAARLEQAMRDARAKMAVTDAVARQLPQAGSTIHRLLGPLRGSVQFRHDHRAPLPIDCVLVDEASMIDLALMAKLIRALPRHARLILLGDQHQLASVEAGAVMASLMAGPPGYRAAFAGRVAPLAGIDIPVGVHDNALADACVRLERSHRFDPGSPVGRLARAILSGDAATIQHDLEVPAPTHLDGSGAQSIDDAIRRGFTLYVDAVREGRSPSAVLDAFSRFRVLCTHRHGAAGVVEMNRRIETLLRPLLPASRANGRDWYAGRVIMISRNDYLLDLYNGDLGVALADPLDNGALRVYFEATGPGVKSLVPNRVPASESAFAMTVHKSQGSEFDEVLIVLPNEPSPLVSRELLYTAVTRARKSVRIIGNPAIVVHGAHSSQHRESGLADKLWTSTPAK